MSKAVRKQLFSIFDTLQTANQLVAQLLADSRSNDIINLLADCQDGAIAIGNQMEAIYGSDLHSVKALESYCEKAYQLVMSLEEPDQRNEVYAQVCCQIAEIRKCMETEIPDKLEVVFLPYKAAMWDSLESIWFAAREDEECEAYVIPIPYYEKNPDGSFQTEHYEGDEYPEYVPVTRYQEYDLQMRHPDIIFFHNPYDNGNYVTSVHPFFYAENIKKFTDKLVYVPYFILNGEGIDDQFVLTSGVVHADYVIVLNEKEREDYLRILQGAVPGMEFADKILPLGSPKMDKVCALNKENINAPREWQERIGEKKVILYNTSIAALLAGDKQYIRKMEDVFTFFQNRDDAVLLWRPHPLMESTLISIRPALYTEYMLLKNRFIGEKIGIYDETPEMHTAIGLSDAYYGDQSSLVWLYRQTGKMALIQSDKKILEGEKLEIEDIIVMENKLFLLTKKMGGLFSYSIEDSKLTFLGLAVRQGVSQNSYRAITHYKNKIIFAPYFADEIAIFDMEKELFEYIPLPGKIPDIRRYTAIISYKNKAFFTSNTGSLLCLDIDSYAVTPMLKWQEEFLQIYGKETTIIMHMGYCKVEDCFWVPLRSNDMVMQYNMKSNLWKFQHVGDNEIQYNTICYDGKYFWLSGEKKCIVRWDKEENETLIFDDFPVDFSIVKEKCGWNSIFFGSLLCNNYIFFAPLKANMLIRLDLLKGRLECVKRIDMDRICLVMKEINNQKIYFEEMILETLELKSTYEIKSTGEYFEEHFEFGTDSEKTKLGEGRVGYLEKKIFERIINNAQGGSLSPQLETEVGKVIYNTVS